MPEDPEVPRVRLDPCHDRANERGLAGAVGAQESEDFSGSNGKRHAIQRAVVPKRLDEISDLERERLGHERII
jgi:hypothetical protein